MTFSKAAILLTGSTGFLGAEVCRVFEANGLKVLKTQGRAGSGSGENCIDVASTDVAGLAGILKAENCLATLHFATDFSSEEDPKIAEQVCATNLSFAIKVAEASALAGVPHFLNVASTWEWLRIANSKRTPPFPPYSASKQAFRTYLDHRFGPVGYVKNLVIEESLGEGDARPKLVPSLISAGLRGEIFLVKDPDVSMNFADSTALASFLLQNLPDLGRLPYLFGYADYIDVKFEDLVREFRNLGLALQTRNSTNEVNQSYAHSRVTLQSLGIPVLSSARRSLKEALSGMLIWAGFEALEKK